MTTSPLDLLLDIEDQLALLGTRLATAAAGNPALAADQQRFEALRRQVKADINRLLAKELDAAGAQMQAAVAKLTPLSSRLAAALATTNAAAAGLDVASQVLSVAAEIAVGLATL